MLRPREGLGKVVLRTWGSPDPSLRKHLFLSNFHHLHHRLPSSRSGLICLPTQPSQNGPRVQTGYGTTGERRSWGLRGPCFILYWPVVARGFPCNA